MSSRVTVIIPVYNEAQALPATLQRLAMTPAVGYVREIVAVDDGSTDGSGQTLDAWATAPGHQVIHLATNQGKAAAIQAGLAAARGDVVLLHDADGEYDPTDHAAVLAPLLANQADAVWGNRMHRGNPVGYRRYWLGNFAISLLASLLYGQRIHDLETGAKAFRRQLILPETLRAHGFGVEVELTVRLLQAKVRLREVPVRYRPRGFAQGKKISWRDGVRAVGLLVWYRIFGR